ncbi:hypothetical protein DRW03_34010 [Corallococcus sp. H22C18031201]|nr:hypothetical protein DRW03_34010 [Corallococcus sp. H22C18031201]
MDPPRYDTVQVLDGATGELSWHLRAEPFGERNGVRLLRYGETPRGFAVIQGPCPLRPRGRYALFVVGQARGALHFEVDPEGEVFVVSP